MDSYLLEIVAGLTLTVCLWVLKTVHVMALDVRGMKTDISHMPTKDEMTKKIAETRHLLRNEIQEGILKQ